MYRRFAVVFAVAALVALGASQAQAKTIQATETIKGTLAVISPGGPGGGCTESYSAQCPTIFGEPATCTCLNDELGTITGGIGKGDVHIDITVDASDEVEDTVEHGCKPIFGELSLNRARARHNRGWLRYKWVLLPDRRKSYDRQRIWGGRRNVRPRHRQGGAQTPWTYHGSGGKLPLVRENATRARLADASLASSSSAFRFI